MRASPPGVSDRVLRLFPPPAVEKAGPVYSDLELPGPGDGSRPYVVVNMVSGVDGARAVAGKASGIGGEADRRAMRALRSKVDAVMIGAGTLRAEKLNLGLDDPRDGQPLAVIIAGEGPLPIEERLVRNKGQRVLVLRPGSTQAEHENPVAGARSAFVPAAGDGRVEMRSCLDVLRRSHGVNRLLVEGGPTLNGALIGANLADEYFLTVAPKLLQGESGQPQPATRAHTQNLDLLSIHLQNGELFLRYALRK